MREVMAIVPAAGSGTRMGADIPKQYLELAGATVLERTLAVLLGEKRIAAVVVALAPGDTRFARLPVAADPRIITVTGGATRDRTVREALEVVRTDWVLVHDAARPLLPPADLTALLDCGAGDPAFPGAILAAPVHDTLKLATGGHIVRTVPRDGMYRALTPQFFATARLREALDAARARGLAVTDEASALELMGVQPLLVHGSERNFKITTPSDLELARMLLAAEAAGAVRNDRT